MRSRYLPPLVVSFALVTWSGWASAQTLPPAGPPAAAPAVSAVGGLSASSATSGVLVGATFTYPVTDRVSFEALGSYLGRGPGARALNLNFGMLVNLLPADRKAVPYVALGGGLYRTSFDLDNAHLFGGLMSQYAPGTQLVPFGGMLGFGMMQGYTGTMWQGPWTGPTFDPQDMPHFYESRLGMMTVPANGRWGARRFTDPVISLGGGLNAALTSHVFVRPDARALVVLANGDHYTVGVMSFSLGYRF